MRQKDAALARDSTAPRHVSKGYKHTDVGVIPENWNCVLLDTVARRGSGHTPSKSYPEYWGGGIKWVSLQDSPNLDRLYISDTAANISELGLANSSAVIHPAGIVILSRDAGVGKSAITTEPMAVSQHFMAWDCSGRLNNHFLYYWLQVQKPEFERIAIGNTIKTIGLSFFKRYAIPLPSLAEQEAIAEALSDADALIDGLESLIDKKRAIKQGAMQELLMGKRRLPGFEGKWTDATIGCFANCSRGVSYNPTTDLCSDDAARTFRLLRSINIYQSSITLTDLQFVKDRRVSATQQMRFDDILICMANGSRELVGKSARFSIEDGYTYTFGAFMGVLRPEKDKADAKFIFYLTQTKRYRTQISVLLAGSSINNLTPSSVESLRFAFPIDRAEQAAIATILTDMDDEIAVLQEKLTKARQLKQGMMQELLTGRIRLV